MRQLIESLKRRLISPTETLEGYEHPELIEVIFQKTVRYVPQEPWHDLAGATTVLDFGGGCGIHYKQANLPDVRWAVVETPAMVKRAQEIATDRLQFFSTIADAAAWLGPIDMMHSNGAIQCVSDPAETLTRLCALRARKMLWQRVWFSAAGVERTTHLSHLSDNGPGKAVTANKAVKYEFTKIPEAEFIAAHRGYDLVERRGDQFKFTLCEGFAAFVVDTKGI